MQKNSFVLQTRLNAVVAKLSDKQAGVLFKSILNYAASGAVANFEDNAVDIAFEMVRQDIDYNAVKYNQVCEKRKEAVAKRWSKKKQNNTKNTNVYKCIQNDTNAYKAIHNDNDVDVDVDNDVDIKQQRLTAAPKPADPLSKPKRELNDLQKFSNAVIESFEPDVKTEQEKRIWFKRNCRCLSDILNFCGKNIPLGIATIDVCLERMEKAKIEGAGYEAVCRNLPFYRQEAKKKLGGTYA